MQVRFTETAEQDLLETLAYFRAPSALGEQFDKLVEAVVDYLQEWPFTGHRRRDLTPKDVCFWYEEPYMFAMQIRDNTLTILAVLHHRRNIKPVLHARLKRQRNN